MKNSSTPGGSITSMDLPDSPKDKKEMQQPESTFIDLPELSDIPGQENIVPAPFGEMTDITSSSADEEGEDIFEDDLNEVIDENSDSNVSETEKEDLERTATDMPEGDDDNLRDAALDNTDDDGTPLNEGGFKKNISATDLDIPGAKLDDADEKIGEEDEENNDYSLGADNDVIPEDEF